MDNLTYEQSLALSLDKHLAVTANAGSGKTKVLVQRYLKIIIEKVATGHCELEEIAAITFTRKAAAEMQAKIIKELDSIIQNSVDDEFIRKIEDIRNNMMYARISTIHSFCSRLLKDYPIEAGILPNFSELDDYDHRMMIEDSIDETFEKWLEPDNPKRNKFLYELLGAFGVEDVRTFLRKILLSNELLRSLLNFYDKFTDIDSLCTFYNKQFFRQTKEQLLTLLYEFTSNGENLVNKFPKKSNLIEPLIIKYFDLHAELINDNSFSFSNSINKFVDFNSDTKIKISQAHLSTEVKKLSQEFSKNIEKLTKTYEEFGEMKDSEIEKLTHTYISSILLLLELTKETADKISQTKQKIPALTFDDILLKTLEMLEKNYNDVRSKIRSDLKYLLVDEFQDTNQIQYDIIKYLVSDLNKEESISKTNLFIVGDDKQSIYGFRAADVRVFNAIKQDILNTNKRKNANTNPALQDNGIINLDISFRLQPVVSHFINYICQPLMDSNINEFEVDYSDFINGRISEQYISDCNDSNFSDLSEKYGSVHFINFIQKKKKDEEHLEIHDENDPDNENANEFDESEMIAAFIKNAISDKTKIKIPEKDGTFRTPNFGDFAIIVRKRNNFTQLSKSFLKNQIPYEISSGSGFFQSPEIIDFQCALKFFFNNNDDIALAGFLKSYMLMLNDNHLFEIALTQKDGSFWEKFQKYALSKEADFIVKRAYKIISDLLKISLKIPVSKLINILTEKTAVIATTSTNYASEQIKANIQRFIDYTRAFESKGFKSLYDLILQLNDLAENSKEPEAAVFNSTDSVKIMTIHASKGLEFPVVILAFSNFRESVNQTILFDKDYGIAAPYTHPGESNPDFKIKLPLHKIIKDRINEADRAELKRLLYVGMSRAKDHLVISGALKETKDGYGKPSGFLRLIFDSMNSYSAQSGAVKSELDISEFFEKGLIINGNLKYYSNSKTFDSNISYKVDFLNKIEDIAVISEEETEESQGIIITDRIQNEDKFEILSASRLSSLQHDDYEYDFKYFLGLPAANDMKMNGLFPSADGDNEQIIGSKAGTYIHEILQSINFWLGDNFEIDNRNFNSEILEIEKKYSSRINDKLRQRIFNECNNIAQTKFVKSNFKLFKNAEFEKSYSLPFNNDILTATFDLLLKYEDGSIEICDWKSNRIPPDGIEEIAEHYRIQMHCYAYFAQLLAPKQQHFKCNLLFTRLASTDCDDNKWIYTFNFTKEEALGFEDILNKNQNPMKYPYIKNNGILLN